MPIQNADVAQVFEQIADLLALSGDNPFRIRAYRNAARTLRGLGKSVRAMVAAGEDLTDLPGIGDDLAGKIREVLDTGSVELLRRLQQRVPAELPALLDLPGLGPVRVRTLHDRLGVTSVADLARAAEEGRLHDLPGIGPKTVARVRAALATREIGARRHLLAEADAVAGDLVAWLQRTRGVSAVEVAGSLRRGCETVGDVDLLACARGPTRVVERLVRYADVAEVLARGDTRAAVRLRSGLQVDLRVVDPASHGAALCYLTGSKAHNVALRTRAQARGLKLNEYGVYRGEERVAGDTEASVYAALGVALIPPELREDRGEIAAAEGGALPPLITLADLRGDLHAHTVATDGSATIAAMAAAARAAGLSYLAITDHSRRLRMVHGLDGDAVLAQVDAIAALNAQSGDGFQVLSGIEVDVLEDGRLDLPDEVLARLDVVVAAVHGWFELPREKQTARVLRALDNRYVAVLAHPTGRLLLARAPCELDAPRIFAAARDAGVALELNAHPERLDLSDELCRQARAAGAKIVIGSDAHGPSQFALLRYGVLQARRAGLGPRDVLNTLPLAELRAALRRR